MDTQSAFDRNTQAVAAELTLLHSRLKEAVYRSAAAHEQIQRGNRNGALGCIAGLDALLTEAKSLYRAAVALHRTITAAPAQGGQREIAVFRALEDIRTRYPNIKPWISPGGCFSLRHPCSDGGYLSITDPLDEVKAEDLTDGTEALGALVIERYSADDEIVEPACLVPFEKVSEWIDTALRRASTPKGVVDPS